MTKSGTTWDKVNLMLPEVISWFPMASSSPTPIQLNGLIIVYGNPYCSKAPLAKYSQDNFWNPYVEDGGGHSNRCISSVGHFVAFS